MEVLFDTFSFKKKYKRFPRIHIQTDFPPGHGGKFAVLSEVSMALFGNKEARVDLSHLPRHIAIIMDGNGRWASGKGLPRTAGHGAGAETFRRIATLCREMGIPYLTVYAFSTENWKRPAGEVEAILGLLKKYLMEAIAEMEKEKVRFVFFGDLTPLPDELRRLCEETQARSAKFGSCQVNICLNYGGRDEILRSARAFAEQCVQGKRRPEELSETAFANGLWSAGVPDPDLIIRPGGEKRISNFLLWQSAYAEYYFTDVNWPDFSKEELMKALAAYQARQRRYGGI